MVADMTAPMFCDSQGMRMLVMASRQQHRTAEAAGVHPRRAGPEDAAAFDAVLSLCHSRDGAPAGHAVTASGTERA
jgi:hypothetical protein